MKRRKFLKLLGLSLVLAIFFIGCSYDLPIQVIFDGPIYAYTQDGDTYLSVSVRNLGHKTAYNVIATMLVKKNGAYTGLYELDYGLIPPKEAKTLEKQIRNVQFKDDIEVTGTLKWD